MIAIQVIIAEVDRADGSGGVEEELARSPSFRGSSGSADSVVAELKKRHRVSVLSRPSVTTINGYAACVQVGQRVGLLQGTPVPPSKLRAKWAVPESNTTYQPAGSQPAMQPVGLILEVTPRVSKEAVALEIAVEHSEAAPGGDAVPAPAPDGGKRFEAPRINTSTMVTTVTVQSGQTTVLGSLGTSSNQAIVIILTPRVIWNADEAERVN